MTNTKLNRLLDKVCRLASDPRTPTNERGAALDALLRLSGKYQVAFPQAFEPQ